MKISETKLLLKISDHTGECGFVPDWATDEFDTFYTGQTLFHDVFEHFFEWDDEYFNGDAFLNVGGEMVANGFCIYLFDELLIHNRPLQNNSMCNFSDSVAFNVTGMIDNIYNNDGDMYGNAIVSNVPKQKKPEEYNECEVVIQRIFEECPYLTKADKRKVKDLHRYGWNMAQKLYGEYQYTTHNSLYSFIEFWNDFTKKISAEELLNMGCKSATFKVFKGENGVYWNCSISNHYTNDTFVTTKNKPVFLDATPFIERIEQKYNDQYIIKPKR